MSGLMTPRLDELFIALTENLPISNKLIQGAQDEYQKLRSTVVKTERESRRGQRSQPTHQKDDPTHGSRNSRTPDSEVCPHCKHNLGTERAEEVSRLRKELYLKATMCKDLQEQLNYYRQNSTRPQMQKGVSEGRSKGESLQAIGRRHNELFENEWKWTFDFMDNQLNMREDKILETLLRIYRASYKFCDDIAKSQIANIEGELLCPLSTWTESRRIELMTHRPDVTPDTSTIAKQYRTSTSRECLPSLQEAFLAHILPEFIDREHISENTILSYAKQCVSVCWIICIADPSLTFVAKVNRKDAFDSHRFRHYVKDGDKFDFVVWPALVSYEKGAVICKGVAQALDNDRSNLTLRSSRSPSGATPNKPEPMPTNKSPNAAIRGTPWGSQQFSNRGTPSVDLPPFPDDDTQQPETERPENESPTKQRKNSKINSRTISIPGTTKDTQLNGSPSRQTSDNVHGESPGKKVTPVSEGSNLTSAWKERHANMKPSEK